MTRFVGFHRRGVSPAAAKARWRALLEAARAVAAIAQRGGFETLPGERPGLMVRGSASARLSEFRHALAGTPRLAFPCEGESPRLAAQAFGCLGRAFEIADEGRRAVFAAALAACAEALEQLLDEERNTAAREHTRRIMGERD